MCKKGFLSLISIFITILAHSQTFLGFEFDASIPVKIGSTPLQNPWAGGINFGQFSTIDIDFDGDDDLVIFDRSADEFVIMEHVIIGATPSYTYKYGGTNYFPSDCRYRTAFIDYDMDGKKDLFTYGIGGIKVYRNVGNGSIGLQWQLITPILQTNSLGNMENLFVSASDIPAYVDVDFDGDIDVLTFHIGGELVQYHQNQSMELYGIPDSLTFELKNQCWGRFREDPNNNSVFLNETMYPCSNGDVPTPLREMSPTKEPELTVTRHSGSTLLALDIDHNGVMDLVLGDVAYPNLTLLINGGSAPNTNSAMVTQNNAFPSNSTPANINLFPAMFLEDVDFDGKKDLIVAPNARTVSENQTSVWFYKNTGTNELPVFSYQTNAFLQNQMIDAGLGSIPVLVDYNGDGLEDLLVSSFFRYKPVLNKESAFMLYENTGTPTNPEYTLVSSDYLGLSSQNIGFRPVPTFGDLDGDGDLDMILGKENGTLSLYTNSAGLGNPLSFLAPVNLTNSTSGPIQVGGYAHPQLFDLNNDGLLDLVIGKKTGELDYYQNVGSVNTPQFTLISNLLGQVDVSTTPDGYASPYFFRVNDTTRLFVGNYEGTLIYFDQIDGNLAHGNAFHLVNDHFLNLDVGIYSSFAVSDVDQDGLLNLFVGQDLGGLHHFEADPSSTMSIQTHVLNQFTVYPNPTSGILSIDGIENTSVQHLVIFDLQGKKILEGFNQNQIDISSLINGIYLIQLSNGKSIETHRIIKR